MNIAIDFDDTLTADPLLWRAFITDARSKGHTLYCVTARRPTEENAEELESWFDQWDIQLYVIYTSLASKLVTMESRGIKVDIWIDDSPRTLVHGH